MPIYIDSLDQLPDHISTMLVSLRTEFLNANCIDDLVRNSRHIDAIQRAITDFLEENGVVAYHYTRAYKKSIKDNGLLLQCNRETNVGNGFWIPMDIFSHLARFLS